MSWDVVLIRTKTNKEPLEEIESENIIPFSFAEFTQEMQKIAGQQSAEYDPTIASQLMRTNTWSIEVYPEEENESIGLSIRGSEEPTEVLKALHKDLGCRLIDCCTSEFIDFTKSSSFEKWKSYRDQIIESYNN